MFICVAPLFHVEQWKELWVSQSPSLYWLFYFFKGIISHAIPKNYCPSRSWQACLSCSSSPLRVGRKSQHRKNYSLTSTFSSPKRKTPAERLSRRHAPKDRQSSRRFVLTKGWKRSTRAPVPPRAHVGSDCKKSNYCSFPQRLRNISVHIKQILVQKSKCEYQKRKYQ